ncbi:MAG: hypothetical protein WBJ10_11705 [Daejeonella sp.]|uniref:hypothetical protein n=1 Tax=Daejeonella sp. TaxID=2805397 RepID=UPI003C763948
MTKIDSLFFRTTAVLTIAVVFNCQSQTTTFGGRFTYQLHSPAYVENPSPSNIFSPYHTRSEKSIYALRYFRKEKWGLKLGIENGSIPFYIGIDAPSDAFGDVREPGGDPQIIYIYGVNDFNYKSATVSAVRRIPMGSRHLEITAVLSPFFQA